MKRTDKADKRITATYKWVEEMVVGLNLCPFAKKVLLQESMRLEVCDTTNTEEMLSFLAKEFKVLDENAAVSTSLLLYPGLEAFEDYLNFSDLCNMLLEQLGYEGVYQIATFHPDYCFAGTGVNDQSNYTNRAPYPVIHLLREDELSNVLQFYPNPELIPERNIELMESMSKDALDAILERCKMHD